ncbi:vacuolar protein sorting-associated protein 33B [Bacillus rossius redtenbacheri]|uniref:vacuolar protein sorting-associated protein 33B n=1 Tax=Bacillus rossius redtenbacheri TaxID=93214 RepID=UPI002FDEF03C
MESAFDSRLDALQLISQRKLSEILQNVPGKKNIIIDPVLMKSLDNVIGVSFLRSQGIEKIFKLKEVGVGCEKSQCIYLVLADLITMKRVCDQICAEIAHDRHNVYHLILVPCSLFSIEQLLEEEGIYGEVTVHTFSWEMHHIDTNLLSLELPCLFRMLFADGDCSFLPVVAHSLWSLQMLFGRFPLFLAHGRYAVQVQRMQELLLEESSSVEKCASDIDCVLLVDRDIDYASALLTPVTYSALLDEVFGITGGTIELDERVLGANKTLTYKLSKYDEVYDNIKNKHFSDVYSFLSAKTKELQVEFERSSKMALNEIKQYVSTQLQKVTASKRALAYHIGACEVVIGEMGQSFENLHTVEQNMLDGRNRRENINYVEEHLAIAGKIASLRLLCLASLTQDGLLQDEALSFKSQFLHAYGYEHLATFNNLEKMGLFTQQGSALSLSSLASDTAGKLADRVAQVVSLPKRSAFQAVSNKLKLFPNVNDKYDLKNPKDMAYVFSGSYIPAVCQLIQMLIRQELSVDEILKQIPGPSSKRGSFLNGATAPRTYLVYFIGGVTYAEVAAFHLLEKQTGTKILVAGTSLTNGNKLIESAFG